MDIFKDKWYVKNIKDKLEKLFYIPWSLKTISIAICNNCFSRIQLNGDIYLCRRFLIDK